MKSVHFDGERKVGDLKGAKCVFLKGNEELSLCRQKALCMLHRAAEA